MNYTQIDNNGIGISASALSGPVDAAHMIEAPDYETALSRLGMKYEGGAWVAGPAPAPAPRHLSNKAFRFRFTRAEKQAIEMAAVDDPAQPAAQRLTAAGIRSDLKDQASAKFIDLDDADTRAGVQALESYGLIGAGRAAEILDAPVQSEESP